MLPPPGIEPALHSVLRVQSIKSLSYGVGTTFNYFPFYIIMNITLINSDLNLHAKSTSINAIRIFDRFATVLILIVWDMKTGCRDWHMWRRSRQIVSKVAANRVVPMLPSSESARRHCKLYHLRPKIYFRQKVETLFVRKYCLCLW